MTSLKKFPRSNLRLTGSFEKKTDFEKNTFEAKQKQKPGRRQSGLPEMKTMKILEKKSGCKKMDLFEMRLLIIVGG